MIGKQFDKWSVLSFVEIDKPGKHYECMCHCGNIRIKKGTELRAGRGKQCQECQYRELYDTEKEIGKVYGKWTIIRYIDIYKNLQRYEAQCECGYLGIHQAATLRAGKSKQCSNCHNRENAKANTKHGMHKELIYKVWSSMLGRCTSPNLACYKWYGGRGIKVCEEWKKFEGFYRDMGPRPEGMTLDRINNDGNYEKSNCRWVSHKENCQNRERRKK